MAKTALSLLVGMLVSAAVIWLSLHDQLHGSSVKGWIFEQVAGTGAYNAVYLFIAMFAFIVCLLGLLFVGFAGVSASLAARAKAERKAARRAAWEAKQAQAAQGSSDGVS